MKPETIALDFYIREACVLSSPSPAPPPPAADSNTVDSWVLVLVVIVALLLLAGLGVFFAIRMRRLRRATPRVVVAVERPDGSLTPAYVTSEVELKDLEDAAAASRATVPGADTGTSTSGLLSVPINLNAASRI